MKRLLVIALSCIAIYGCSSNAENEKSSDSGFAISGNLQNADSSWVLLQKRAEGKWVSLDSAQVFNGQFTLSGSTDSPEMHYLKIGDRRGYTPVFMENSQITISGDADSLQNISISGSVLHNKYKAHNESLKPFRERIKELLPKYDIADSLGDAIMEAELDSIYEAIYDEQNEFTKTVIADNSENALGPYLTSNIYYNDEKLEELEGIMSNFTGDATISSSYIKLTGMIATWKSVAVGQPAVEIIQADSTGTDLALSSLKGNYVLIDFWASWCGPCRKENPNVVKLYNEMHDKGFEILGVSFDTDRAKWLKAIEDDGLTWPHVSDLQGWSNAAGKLYGVNAIPHTVLLDKEGIIIAKNLRGEELREKLEELLM